MYLVGEAYDEERESQRGARRIWHGSWSGYKLNLSFQAEKDPWEQRRHSEASHQGHRSKRVGMHRDISPGSYKIG